MNISVIIPVHNAAETLVSLCAQTFLDWETIVVDDGSSDETASAAARLAETDRRLRVLRRPHRGVSAALKAGLRAAHGDWMLFFARLGV